MPILYKLIIAENGKPRYSPLEFCHSCGSTDIIFDRHAKGKNSHQAKNGRWSCLDCDASVAAHSDGRPQGYLADQRVRTMRYNFHKAMNVLLDQKYEYDDICSYLQARLHIESDYLHSAWLTMGELVRAIEYMQERAKRPYKNRPYKVKLVRVSKQRKESYAAKQQRHKREGYYCA